MSRSGNSGGNGPQDPDKDAGSGGEGGRAGGRAGAGGKPGEGHGEAGGQNDDDYQVGYGRPPRHSRFGYGNKMGRGRRKGSKNLGTVFNEAMNGKVAFKNEGRKRKLTKREVMLLQLVNLAAKGELKAIAKAIELDERYGPREDGEGLTAEQMRRDLEAYQQFWAIRGALEDDDAN